MTENNRIIQINFYIIIFQTELEKFSQSPNHRPNPIEIGDTCSIPPT
jgi:hypothetical protein